jgi:Putative 2OG-Fe(II) oxygenase
VLFPSWLYHWVHPYAGETPRIAISFNATIGAHAVDKAGIDEGRAATVATDITHQFPANVIGWAARVEDLNSHADKV